MINTKWIAFMWWVSGASSSFALANWALGYREWLPVLGAFVLTIGAAGETWLLPWAERKLKQQRWRHGRSIE